jgi:pimeloyl-ACP methyl ester carboxylesterase
MSASQTIRERYFIDGRWLEALKIEARDPRLPFIVMLHEGLGSVAHWKAFPFLLAEATGAGVFVFSRYGHGTSDALGEPRSVFYMHDEAQVVLPEVLQKAGIARPVLLGHSDGASIAILYAGIFPDSPAGLILEAPHVFVEDITVASIERTREQYDKTGLAKKLGRYHTHVDSLFWGWNNIWLDPAFRSWNIESSLDLIRCPVLVIQGAEDEYGTSRQVRSIQRRIPQASAIILEGCKYAPHRDRSDATVIAIGKFLQRWETALL